MNDWTVQPFAKDHERAGFSCGSPALDDFIRTRVSQYEKRRLGKTFVAVPIASKQVIGFYTHAAGGVSFEHLPSQLNGKRANNIICCPDYFLAWQALDLD
jgi:hypothetical protein